MSAQPGRLPPGQRAIDGFPRFGTHLHEPPPAVPADPVIEVGGAVAEPFTVRLADLWALPRHEQESDFHCVAGWSATGLRWEGVAMRTVYRELLEPAAAPGPPVTHLVFGGLDGYRSYALLEDALADDVLIAERLDGRPLDGDHGAPARLVSPGQYGFVSTKHLSRIELHTGAPQEGFGAASAIARFGFRYLPIFGRQERARVWEQERHPTFPLWALMPVYRVLTPAIGFLSARGSRGRAGRRRR